MSLLVDTHCHLDFNSFDHDRQAVLQRARQVGVERLLNPAIDLQSSRGILDLADSLPDEAAPRVYAALGVHPNDALGWQESWLDTLRELAVHPRAVAIGEIGLDYYWGKTPKEVQQQAFRAQLALAAELDLPVVIHNREATRDLLVILLEWQSALQAAGNPLAQRPGVLHSFSAGPAEAELAWRHHFLTGVTGPVTFRKAEVLRQVVAAAPLEQLLVETDAPFLTPHPHRGERNEPGYVRLVADKIAEIKNLPAETVAAATTENAHRVFRW